MSEFPLIPPQASSIASSTDLMLLVLIGLSSFFTTIVVGLIFYFGAKYRRGRQVDRSNPPTTHAGLELSWMGGLLVLALGTFIGGTLLYFRITRPPAEAIEIYVVGQQWMWKFQHPEGVREIDELHVPLGSNVRLVMTSQDVIHSMFIPAFRLKYDVLPGRYTSLWFKATELGEYHLFCTEYCGTDHSQMIGTVFVMEPRLYQEWLSGGAPQQNLAQEGEQLFTQLGCSSCHAEGSGVQAPNLAGLFGQPVPLDDGSSVTADENYIRQSILLPQEKIVAGYQPIMPTYEGRITEEQIITLVEYIKTLDSGTGQDQP